MNFYSHINFPFFVLIVAAMFQMTIKMKTMMMMMDTLKTIKTVKRLTMRMVVMRKMLLLWCLMSLLWSGTTIFKRKVWLPILLVCQAILPLFMILHWVHSVSMFFEFVYSYSYNMTLFKQVKFPPRYVPIEHLLPCTVSSFIFLHDSWDSIRDATNHHLVIGVFSFKKNLK